MSATKATTSCPAPPTRPPMCIVDMLLPKIELTLLRPTSRLRLLGHELMSRVPVKRGRWGSRPQRAAVCGHSHHILPSNTTASADVHRGRHAAQEWAHHAPARQDDHDWAS